MRGRFYYKKEMVDETPGIACKHHGGCMGFSWDLHGVYMGVTWWSYGGHMGFTWFFHGAMNNQ